VGETSLQIAEGEELFKIHVHLPTRVAEEMPQRCLPTACAGVQRWDVLGEGVREHRLQLRAPAHAAAFVNRHIFEPETGGLLGHGMARLLCEELQVICWQEITRMTERWARRKLAREEDRAVSMRKRSHRPKFLRCYREARHGTQ
jgi:hypothetical protein